MSITQAEFARRMNVSRKTVSVWKNEGRLVIFDGNVDEEASRIRLTQCATRRSKRGGSEPQKVTPELEKGNNAVPQVTPAAAIYDPPASYGNPANLPDVVVNAATAISSGAHDLAELLAGHMPLAMLRPLLEAWVQRQRAGWVGGPGLPDAIADEDGWPAPPTGFAHWCNHPLFTRPAITAAEWQEIDANAKAAA
jgi:hypothetical protein